MSDRPNSRQRGYTSAWEKARAAYLRRHPFCVECKSQGDTVPATVVDHVIPHRGDMKLFWDRPNWQSLCKLHHDSTKQRQEKGGQAVGCDINGMPTDPAHPWNQG